MSTVLPRGNPGLGGGGGQGMVFAFCRKADLTQVLSSSNKCAKSGRWYRIIRARLLFARSFTLAFARSVVFSSLERKMYSAFCRKASRHSSELS